MGEYGAERGKTTMFVELKIESREMEGCTIDDMWKLGEFFFFQD